VFPIKFWYVSVCSKKSAVLACLAMAKLKMNQRIIHKIADLLKKINLMGTELVFVRNEQIFRKHELCFC